MAKAGGLAAVIVLTSVLAACATPPAPLTDTSGLITVYPPVGFRDTTDNRSDPPSSCGTNGCKSRTLMSVGKEHTTCVFYELQHQPPPTGKSVTDEAKIVANALAVLFRRWVYQPTAEQLRRHPGVQRWNLKADTPIVLVSERFTVDKKIGWRMVFKEEMQTSTMVGDIALERMAVAVPLTRSEGGLVARYLGAICFSVDRDRQQRERALNQLTEMVQTMRIHDRVDRPAS